MCLNDGAFNNHQIVPSSFFQDIRTNASAAKLSQVPLLGKLMPEGVGYRCFYHYPQCGDAIAAAGTYGQFCSIAPKYQTVIAIFSTLPALVPGADLESAFEPYCRLQREQWHLCHELAQAIG
jgi:CubicO group peptidase (beta-lactamase class C family)